MTGEWRPILRGLYFVAPDGQVIDSSGTVLDTGYDDDGHQVVTLTANGQEHTGRVRDLVAQVFAPETKRARVLNKLGVPASDYAPAPRWLAGSDLGAPADLTVPAVISIRPTTTDMGAGNPRNGVSPW